MLVWWVVYYYSFRKILFQGYWSPFSVSLYTNTMLAEKVVFRPCATPFLCCLWVGSVTRVMLSKHPSPSGPSGQQRPGPVARRSDPRLRCCEPSALRGSHFIYIYIYYKKTRTKVNRYLHNCCHKMEVKSNLLYIFSLIQKFFSNIESSVLIRLRTIGL